MNNTQEKRNDNDTKKIVTMLVLVFTLMFCTTGATYAFLAFTASNSNVVTGTVASGGLGLTVSQADLKSVNTGVMVPQLESALGTAMNSTNKCVDSNNNIVCKVYTITATNNSTAGVTVNATISFEGTNTSLINLKWKLVSSTTSVGTTTTGSYSSDNTNVCIKNNNGTACDSFPTYDLFTGTACSITNNGGCTNKALLKNSSLGNYLVVWIDETGEEQNDSGTWKATITYAGANGKGITSTITS